MSFDIYKKGFLHTQTTYCWGNAITGEKKSKTLIITHTVNKKIRTEQTQGQKQEKEGWGKPAWVRDWRCTLVCEEKITERRGKVHASLWVNKLSD